jgi:hypothetical protein
MQRLFAEMFRERFQQAPDSNTGLFKFVSVCLVFSAKSKKLLNHEWIVSGVAGKNSVGISPDQMQMTMRVHNQTRKVTSLFVVCRC